jgi:protein phosphatase
MVNTQHLGSIKEMQPQYTVRSETNQRQNNEDSFQVLPLAIAPGQKPLFVLSIADGMGGLAYGEKVSREALKKVSIALFEELVVEPSINCWQSLPPIDANRLSQALTNALEQANAHLRRMVEANKWGKAGSTIVVAGIIEDTAVVVNLGDSPLFHYQARSGQLTKVTQDHTVAGVLLRAELITPEMARYHQGRSQLEFYLGCPQLPPIPAYQLKLAPGDLLLLCSDGISGTLLHEQIAAILAEPNSSLESIADSLLRVSREAGETDNQTLILWRHQSEEGERGSSGEPKSKI